MHTEKEKHVLVAALDWGLGHATRCVPLIRRLQNNGCHVILASSGQAKEFFIRYFPELLVLDKPAYNITYPKNSSMTWSMLLQSPSIVRTVIRENFWLKKIIREHNLGKIYSDNCYGLWNKKIHTVFITHQIFIQVPLRLKFISSLLNLIVRTIAEKYNECHIPDTNDYKNYSGELSHNGRLPRNATYTGIQSRFSGNKNYRVSEFNDIVLLLSGPEPQRTMLEEKFLHLLPELKMKCCIVRGLPGSEVEKQNTETLAWHNHLSDDELKGLLKNAKKIICRSGYSTIMDLAELDLAALLIPTPGQTEQEYLAIYNSVEKQFSWIKQDSLDVAAIKNSFNNIEDPVLTEL